MKQLCAVFYLINFFIFWGTAQSQPTIHQQQLAYYDSIGLDGNAYQNNYQHKEVFHSKTGDCQTNKIVFGWHPYWSNGSEVNYRWGLLTDLSYFSYEVNPNTGQANSTHNFSTAAVIDSALQYGVRVNLCVTLFSNHATFFASSSAQQTLIINLINLLQSRGITGVNIDFEGIPASQKTYFTIFLQNLSTQLKAAITNAQLSVALYSVDWSAVFDIPNLVNYVDLFCIMGYDYYYGGSTHAGPTDPLFNFAHTYDYTLSKSVTYYLNQGVPKQKLILGLPYYGRTWQISNTDYYAPTVPSTSSTIMYNVVKNNVSGYFDASNEIFDTLSRSNYYTYTSGGNLTRCFISMENSFRERLDFIRKRDIGGMAIWALGYDDGYSDLWNAINDYMTICYTNPCTGILYDIGGGPGNNYYDKEDYTYTIKPENSSSLLVNFTNFGLESGYDKLYLYDGEDTNAIPIPGSPFSGSTLPPTFTASSGAMTIRFTSDGSTNSEGFRLNYQCDLTPDTPFTEILNDSSWRTQDFGLNFHDSTTVTAITEQFYNVADFDESRWNSNLSNGFFNDNFNHVVIDTNWNIVSGIWTESNILNQSDESNGNTNIYSFLNQNDNDAFLYHWKGKIDGSGSNRRAGLHFFVDGNPTLSNRDHSYFVYFRLTGRLQLYKVINDVFALVLDQPYPFMAGNWYDFKVDYNKVSGKIRIYIDDTLQGTWTDTNPITQGNYVSFRSGNCTYEIDDFSVYKSRGNSANITLGFNSDKDVRHQNPNPITPSALVRSIVINNNQKISSIDSAYLNVDWTKPQFIFVNDGNQQNDMDTLYSTSNPIASCNWLANDTNSGISLYKYAIGTFPNDSSVVDWTNNGSNTNLIVSNVNLQFDSLYYLTIRAENGAGLVAVSFSDGFRILKAENVGLTATQLEIPIVFPNPTTNFLLLKNVNHLVSISVFSINGDEVLKMGKQNEEEVSVDVRNLNPGTYMLLLQTQNATFQYKFVKK